MTYTYKLISGKNFTVTMDSGEEFRCVVAADVAELDGLVQCYLDAKSSKAYVQTPADVKAGANAPILAQMAAADIRVIRALVDGDTARIDAHKASQALLRAKLV